MLLSQLPSSPCSFDSTVTSPDNLDDTCSWDKDRSSKEFGGWVVSGPRKRKNRSKEHLSSGIYDETKTKPDKSSSKLQTSNIYYKRYRVDPLEGTFKHHQNIEQYMQLYRETTTLCFKQKTLNELTAMYSTALDINSRRMERKHSKKSLKDTAARVHNIPTIMDTVQMPKIEFVDVTDIFNKNRRTKDYKELNDNDKGHTINGYTYNLDPDVVSKWDGTCHMEEYISHPLTIPPITSRSEGGVPLMLLPTAPSIPHRIQHNTHTNQMSSQSPIAQASFMCNAYMNKNVVCPVHRLIHRKSSLLINNGRVRSQMELSSSPDEHIKVTLPGIPKRRYNSQVKRLKALRESHPIIGLQESSSQPPNTPEGSTPQLSSPSVRDEGEEEADERINQLLNTARSPSNPCDRISKVLQQQQQQLRRPVPSMQLPVTALLQYNPDSNSISKSRHVKKPLVLRSHSRALQSKKKSKDTPKPKPDVKQLKNYEKEYERFFGDVLESKGRTRQRKHFQSMSCKLNSKKALS
ncbi:uncharacterized protein LOC134812872 isoform X2 [Bolinopsis microptera]|uniref:uncharacterized protein LOC134812872 isoform X2 n=1 Tax=Bolinopsis microptera TaxID=2820187 RepID=UPI00307A3CE3